MSKRTVLAQIIIMIQKVYISYIWNHSFQKRYFQGGQQIGCRRIDAADKAKEWLSQCPILHLKGAWPQGNWGPRLPTPEGPQAVLGLGFWFPHCLCTVASCIWWCRKRYRCTWSELFTVEFAQTLLSQVLPQWETMKKGTLQWGQEKAEGKHAWGWLGGQWGKRL